MEIGGWEKFDANGVMGSFWSFCKEVVHISLLKGVQVRVVHGNTIHCGGENHVNFFWRGSGQERRNAHTGWSEEGVGVGCIGMIMDGFQVGKKLGVS